MRLAKILTALAVAAIAGLLLAACGGSDSSEVANLGDAAGTTTEEGSENQASEDPEEAILAYTECMREEGIDLPDPDFSGELGEGGGSGFLGGSDIDPNDPDFRAAQEKCQSNLEGIQGQFDPEDQQALQDAALEFAQCMRDHGFDVPDPDFSEGGPGQGGGGGGGIFGDSGLDPDDPDVQAAMEDCQEAFGDLGGGPGGPGGPPGTQDGES